MCRTNSNQVTRHLPGLQGHKGDEEDTTKRWEQTGMIGHCGPDSVEEVAFEIQRECE